MINCSELLQDYSDYRDGQMSPTGVAAVEAHLAECPSCARYHAAIGWGVSKLRAFPTVEPSADFLPRLQHRIFNVDEQAARWGHSDTSAVSLNFVLVLVLLFGAIAWYPILRGVDHPVQVPPVAAITSAGDDTVRSIVQLEPQLLPTTFSYVRSASNAFLPGQATRGAYANYQTPASPR